MLPHSLALPEQVQALIDYVVTEPAADSEDKVKFIYPYKSSEVSFILSSRPTSHTSPSSSSSCRFSAQISRRFTTACSPTRRCAAISHAHHLPLCDARNSRGFSLQLLNKLFTFLEAEAPLNTLLAGYFGSVQQSLLAESGAETCHAALWLSLFRARNLRFLRSVYGATSKIVSTLLARRPEETLKVASCLTSYAILLLVQLT